MKPDYSSMKLNKHKAEDELTTSQQIDYLKT